MKISDKSIIPIENGRVILYYLAWCILIPVSIVAVIATVQFSRHQEVCQCSILTPYLVLQLMGLFAFMCSGCSRPIRYMIDGEYLMIEGGSIIKYKRKVHFRDISDYTAWSEPLMRLFGFGAISISSKGMGANGIIYIIGLKDNELWRDKLCELDKQ